MRKLIGLMLSLLVVFNVNLTGAAAQENSIDIPQISTLSGLKGSINSSDYSSDDQFIVTGDEEGDISVWNAGNGTLVQQWAATDSYGGVLEVQYRPDDQIIASTDGQSHIKLWDVTSGKLISVLDA